MGIHHLEEEVRPRLEFLEQWFSRSGPQEATSASPGNLGEMQNVGPFPGPVHPKLWRWSPAICFKQPARGF